MPSLKDAAQKPANVGDPIEVATPAVAQRPPTPPYVPNPQGGLATGSLGPAPASFTTPYDSVRQFIRPGVSQNRFPPLPVKANPQSNAVARTIATQVSGSNVSKIELEAPSIFTLTDQTVDLPGPLVLALAPEAHNTVFAGPSIASGVPNFDQAATYSNVSASVITATLTPSYPNEWALWTTAAYGQGTNFGPGAGWTLLQSGYNGQGVWSKLVSSAVTATSTLDTPGNPAVGILALFTTNGLTPAIVQTQSSAGGYSTIPYTLGINPTVARSSLIAIFIGNQYIVSLPTSLSVSDDKGNVWHSAAAVSNTNPVAFMAFCPSPAAGTSIITFSINGNESSAQFIVFEVSNLSQPSAIPSFRLLVTGDIPAINLAAGNINGGVYGVLPAANGGTGTAAPALVAGANIAISGFWPNETIAVTGLKYQTVQAAGVSEPQEPKLNFASGFTVVDNPGNSSTNVSVTSISYAMEIDGAGTALDKQIFINGVANVVSVWGILINGASG